MSWRKWVLISVLCGTLAGCGPWSSGDRVLVSKCSYDNGLAGPHRYNVVVFKWPGDRPGRGPIDNNTPKNYIKRLLGLPGELLAIFFGRVYRWTPPPDAPPPFDDDKNPKIDPNNLWHRDFMHVDDANSRKWFDEGQFDILRKSPAVMLAMRRIVYDNDHQAKDLKGKGDRWKPKAGSSWKTDGPTGLLSDGKAGEDVDWIHYQHLVRIDGNRPDVELKLITDSLAYNNFKMTGEDRALRHSHHWVGDLMLECNVEVLEPKGEFIVELSKGIFRYQARFDLATGQCSLKSIDLAGKEKDLGSQPTSIKSAGNYMIRFANIDARLTLWVDRAMPFGDGKEYHPPEVRARNEEIKDDDLLARRGPRKENDLERPASLGSRGAKVKVTHVRLWRDSYYTARLSSPDYDHVPDLTDPTKWEPIQKANFSTMYVQPGHYLCLGDNSQASSDSRDWGQVPERLMLGRALVVYFPLDRIGFIR